MTRPASAAAVAAPAVTVPSFAVITGGQVQRAQQGPERQITELVADT